MESLMQNTKDVISLSELRERLLSLNSNIEIPFSVIERDKKLIASWKIVDGKWIEILGMGGIKKQYELTLLFDDATKQVSYREKSIDSEQKFLLTSVVLKNMLSMVIVNHSVSVPLGV